MGRNLLKAAYLTLLTALTWCSGVVHVYAKSPYDHTFSKQTWESEAFGDNNSKDNEKIINNVKVFYNPIAEQISLSFKLAKSSSVSIKVMDALGNEILQLMNGNLEGGIQNLSFEHGGKLTTGFYFVRVVAGSETVVKRFSVR
ncbi:MULTISPECIES: T9SS type A sorting domain-containing protein [Sphingobacterium]|uniref:T9SS type A sorting domain-containing protein n=1 Tax=Sphingobacterium TaxID=28453 RepID=UPI0022435E28|nr:MULTISPECIES: T9SS type A sorting domain-containing protein [Sphingobacterium]MCW8312674.1 T9SS type A sorting domain-containing protein [Sphingobacterium sp. InxBP1]